jgi:hypothetical protein
MDSILIPPDQVQPLDWKQLMGQPLGPGFSLVFGSAFGLCLFRTRSQVAVISELMAKENLDYGADYIHRGRL